MQFPIEVLAGMKRVCGYAHTASRHVILLGLFLAILTDTSVAQTAVPKASEIPTHMQQAQAALKTKDIGAAATEFNAVLALDPRNAEAHVNLGVIAFSRGDYRTASQHLRKALAGRPSIPQAQALLGICEKRLGNSSAKGLLESAFSKLKDTKLRTQVGMELVGLYYQQGAPEQALPIVQKLVDINPDDADILYTAQRLYRELADDTLNKLAVISPGSARMQQVIAERLINENDLKGAIEHYRKALEIDPRLLGVRYELAQAILESAKGDSAVQSEAERLLTTVVATEGDSARVQCELGKIALLQSNLELAHTHYTRAFTLDPGNTQAQMGLGRVLMMMNQPQEATKYLEMAVRSDPLNGAAHYQLASAYRRLQITDKAQKEMHLFQEIKKTTDQVEELYRQMNRQPKPQADEVPDNDQ